VIRLIFDTGTILYSQLPVSISDVVSRPHVLRFFGRPFNARISRGKGDEPTNRGLPQSKRLAFPAQLLASIIIQSRQSGLSSDFECFWVRTATAVVQFPIKSLGLRTTAGD
jgi:hypothetical protein